MGTFRDLVVWQKSMKLAQRVHEVILHFPKEEQFGLCSQLSRCSVSIPSNIAEGYGRDGANEHIRFLYISLGSSNELETQMILSHDFHYLADSDFNNIMELNTEVNKMLSSLIFKLRHTETPKITY